MKYLLKKFIEAWLSEVQSCARSEAEETLRISMNLGRALIDAVQIAPVVLLGEALRSLEPEKLAILLQRTLHAYRVDEHRGEIRGNDDWWWEGLDYVPPDTAELSPYCDGGGLGIGLIKIVRKRWYSKSYHRRYGNRPSTRSDCYLIGRNEDGTAFCHAVPPSRTVRAALDWIWMGRASDIIARQGDIALVRGRGPRMPAVLPVRHHVWRRPLVQGGVASIGITHPAHPMLPLPRVGQRIIVARRYGRVTSSQD